MMVDKVREQAQKELAEEEFKEAVEAEKERIRAKVSLWHRICPWVITRRENVRRKAG